MWEDAKLRLKDPKTWERSPSSATRTGSAHVVKAFGWMIPGEVRAFHLDELDAAKA